MVPKWTMKQHMRAGHPTREQIPPHYRPFHNQLKQVTEAERKAIMERGYIPLVKPPVRTEMEPSYFILPDGTQQTMGGVVWSWVRIDSFTSGPMDREPLVADSKAREVIRDMGSIPRIDTGGFIWVPPWVEDAVKMYRTNPQYAGLSLEEFLGKVASTSP